jgi:hypothetical protein
VPLTDEELAALWAEHDHLCGEAGHFRDLLDRVNDLLDRVNDRLLADLKARTGFPCSKEG